MEKSELQPPAATGLNRRSVVRGAAWATPVVVTAGVAPALAASPLKINVGLDITGPATVAQGSTTTYNYVVCNSGTMATTAATTVNIPKPATGTIALGTLPSGWTSVSNGAGGFVVTIPTGLTGCGTIPVLYTAPTTSGANVTLTASIPTGSGGESAANNGNNTATHSLSTVGGTFVVPIFNLRGWEWDNLTARTVARGLQVCAGTSPIPAGGLQITMTLPDFLFTSGVASVTQVDIISGLPWGGSSNWTVALSGNRNRTLTFTYTPAVAAGACVRLSFDVRFSFLGASLLTDGQSPLYYQVSATGYSETPTYVIPHNNDVE